MVSAETGAQARAAADAQSLDGKARARQRASSPDRWQWPGDRGARMVPGGGIAAMAGSQAMMAQQQAFAQKQIQDAARYGPDQSGSDRDDDRDDARHRGKSAVCASQTSRSRRAARLPGYGRSEAVSRADIPSSALIGVALLTS